MKRKAIQLAHQTIVISLPAKWVRQQGIKKGDEIDVEERGKELVINREASFKQKKISLDVEGLTNVLYRVVGALYKAGYTEIEFIYESPEELDIIQKTIRRSLTGFEIIEQSKNRVIVKEVSRLESIEVDKVLKKCFQSLISIGEESLECIKKLDAKGMEKVALMDDAINRYCDFCRRVLNVDQNIPNRTTFYFIAEQLEKIGDMYRDLCRCMAKKTFRVNKNILEIYEEINKFFYDFYEIFYKFDLKKMDDFILKRKKIKEKLNNCINTMAKKETIIIIYLNNILESTFDMNGVLLTMVL